MKQDALKLAKLWHPQPNKFIFSIQIIIFCFISASVQLDLCLINIFCSLKELFWGCCCWTPLTTTPGPPWCPPMQSYQTAEPFFGFSQQDELNSSECEYFVLWKVPPGPLWFLIVEPPKCSQLPFSQCADKSSCVWAFPHPKILWQNVGQVPQFTMGASILMGLVLALSRLLLDLMVSTIEILFSDLYSASYANSDYGKFSCKFLSSPW